MYGFKYEKLKKKITEKYGSMTAFAIAAGCTTACVSLKLSGKHQFSQKDIMHWCDLLGISKNGIPAYFFA